MPLETRITKLSVVPEGQPTFDDGAFNISIADDAGGEFLIVGSNDDQCGCGEIRLDPSDWPALRDAIERMVKECRE